MVFCLLELEPQVVWYAHCALQLKRVSAQHGLLRAQQTRNS